jgi:uncharacterized protein (TIGR02118 family)
MPIPGAPATLAKITGTYRCCDGARFDHDYYASGHAPLGLLRFEADRTARTTEPRPGEIVATSNAYVASVAVARAALASAGAALAADIPRYTNIRPVLHVSDVLVHER